MQQRQPPTLETTSDRDSFMRLLGSPASAVDASVPPVVFGVGWLVSGQSILVGGVAAIVVGAGIAVWRWSRGTRPLAALMSLFVVLVGVAIALSTGQAADFFLARLIGNAVSTVAWTASIVARWPFLGIIVGGLLGQRTQWRRDPVLLRAYSRASWVWVGQYVTRLAVFIPLWAANAVVALGTAQLVLTWPLIVASVGGSWLVIRRSLPADHPGLRHVR